MGDCFGAEDFAVIQIVSVGSQGSLRGEKSVPKPHCLRNTRMPIPVKSRKGRKEI